MSIRLTAAIAVLASAAAGCGSVPIDQRDHVRNEVDAAAEETTAAFVADNPELQDAIDNAAGYFAGTGWAGMFGVLGGADGMGVLYDNSENTRTYLNIMRVDLGPGLGAADLQALAIIDSQETLDMLRKGRWRTSAKLGTAMGESSSMAQWAQGDMDVYLRSKSGAAIGASVKLSKISVNDDLTDVGVSSFGIPNADFEDGTPHPGDPPRVWPYKLPFLGQKVIDKGYDLPLPYGVGITYVDLDQQVDLTKLSVGVNGREKVPFDFVAFDNAFTVVDSYQLRIDAWVLPFMNVFALFGDSQGDAPLDVFLDGNLLLEAAGTDCSGIIRPPLCDSLEDQIISFPVRASVDVATYGLGTMLAGGWKGWFVSVPAMVTYAEPADKIADGSTTTITPRIGRNIDLGNKGSLALFAGGNYLDSELVIEGNFVGPEGLLSLDYTITEETTDPWNYVVGFNWTVNKHWMWALEYNGFTGSRDAWISTLTVRF